MHSARFIYRCSLMSFILVSGVLGLWCSAANAATVIWNWEGEVTAVDSGGPFAAVPIGAPLSGTMVYDDAAGDQTSDPSLGHYYFGGGWPFPGSFTVRIDGAVDSWSHVGISVLDGYLGQPFDQVLGTSGPGGDVVYDVVMAGGDLVSDALPSISVLNDDQTFPWRALQVRDLAITGDPPPLLVGDITTFNASIADAAIPALSPLGVAVLGGLILAMAIGGLAVQRRRREL